VLITTKEKELFERRAGARKAEFLGKLTKFSPKRGFVPYPDLWYMKPPCIFLKDNKCSIHKVRGWKCRMFHCYRLSPNDPYPAESEIIAKLKHDPLAQRTAMKAMRRHEEWKRVMEWDLALSGDVKVV